MPYECSYSEENWKLHPSRICMLSPPFHSSSIGRQMRNPDEDRKQSTRPQEMSTDQVAESTRHSATAHNQAEWWYKFAPRPWTAGGKREASDELPIHELAHQNGINAIVYVLEIVELFVHMWANAKALRFLRLFPVDLQIGHDRVKMRSAS
jgi:hypothetical protein